ASHLAGLQVKRLVDAALGADEEEAGRIDDALKPLFDALFVEPNPIPLKGGMGSMWGPVG
ncbi:MAG: 4-hydroxy-tetrahydrodipicolinate synthase, partial [Actinobacteria bacterium]|nr:4-hydroxy-tetrahydrodipicolinate synthase [Actinomycetota bacterium]